jgi:DNA-binding LacI/PurR family transcriptional regulator
VILQGCPHCYYLPKDSSALIPQLVAQLNGKACPAFWPYSFVVTFSPRIKTPATSPLSLARVSNNSSRGTAQSSRARGFVAGCEKAGLPEPLIFTGEAYATDFQQGRALARDFLHIRPLPDGVFCSNDQLGVALLTQSNDAGLSIPDDMAIVGCDNSEICLYTTPALSSIDTGNSLLASKSLEVLLRLLQDRPDAPVYDNVPVSLVARGSTSGK